MTQTQPPLDGGSQTLSRGLSALELIGESATPLTVPQLAEQLGIHRSMAYRLVRTLEHHGFAIRTGSGELELGTRLAALARDVAHNLKTAATPELFAFANEHGLTTFIVTYDGKDAVTLMSAEPQNVNATVTTKPGTRHSIHHGAPGRVVRSQVDPQQFPPNPYELSQNEVFAGLTSVAVPVAVPDKKPVALAVIYAHNQALDVAALAVRLHLVAQKISAAMH